MKKSISLLGLSSWMNLGQTLKEIEALEPDSLHIDIMDGHFVPNIAFGTQLVEDIACHTDLPLDFHMMINCFGNVFNLYKNIKHRKIYIPIETNSVKSKHISINMNTSLDLIRPHLEYIETVLVMTVKAGFSGQKMLPEPLNKIILLKKLKPSLEIWVDGGVNVETIKMISQFPVDGVVMGKGFFEAENG